MRFIQEYGYSVKVGIEEEHQAWLQANEPKVAEGLPEGVKYIGTFSTVYTSEKKAGGYRTFFELDSYGAQDRIAAAVKDPGSPLGGMLRDLSRFYDTSWDAPWSTGLHKAVVDSTIFDPRS